MRVTVSRCPRWALLRELTAALRSATHTAQPAGSLSPCVSPEQVTVLTQLCSPDHMASTSWDRGKNGQSGLVFSCARALGAAGCQPPSPPALCCGALCSSCCLNWGYGVLLILGTCVFVRNGAQHPEGPSKPPLTTVQHGVSPPLGCRWGLFLVSLTHRL